MLITFIALVLSLIVTLGIVITCLFYKRVTVDNELGRVEKFQVDLVPRVGGCLFKKWVVLVAFSGVSIDWSLIYVFR